MKHLFNAYNLGTWDGKKAQWSRQHHSAMRAQIGPGDDDLDDDGDNDIVAAYGHFSVE